MGRIRTKTGSTSFAVYQLKRAILEQVLQDSYTTEDREEALLYFGGCSFCGSSEAPRNDHLVPVIKLGDFIPGNVVPACQRCDDSKGGRDFREWMRSGAYPGSLPSRGMAKSEIESRIHHIESFIGDYNPRSEKYLFGDQWERYQELIRRMEVLREETQSLIQTVNRNNKP